MSKDLKEVRVWRKNAPGRGKGVGGKALRRALECFLRNSVWLEPGAEGGSRRWDQ